MPKFKVKIDNGEYSTFVEWIPAMNNYIVYIGNGTGTLPNGRTQEPFVTKRAAVDYALEVSEYLN